MKKVYFTLALALGLGFASFSQKNAAKSIQSGKWFVKGAVNGTALTLTSVAADGPDWEAKFSSTGSMHHCLTTKTSVIDPSGIEIKPNTYYCDSLYTYKVKNDVININYPPASYYYKMKALPNNSGYELTPTTVADFK